MMENEKHCILLAIIWELKIGWNVVFGALRALVIVSQAMKNSYNELSSHFFLKYFPLAAFFSLAIFQITHFFFAGTSFQLLLLLTIFFCALWRMNSTVLHAKVLANWVKMRKNDGKICIQCICGSQRNQILCSMGRENPFSRVQSTGKYSWNV